MTSPCPAFATPLALALAFVGGGCSLIDGLQGSDPDDSGLPGIPGTPSDPACAIGNLTTSVTVDTTMTPIDMDLDFEGALTVIDHRPNANGQSIVVQTENGFELALDYQLADEIAPAEVNRSYFGFISTRKPLVGDSRDIVLGLHESPDGVADASAPLVFVGWDTSNIEMLGVFMDDLPVLYQSAFCEPVDDGCGLRGAIELDVDVAGINRVLPPGTDASAAGIRVVNSSTSHEYLFPCLDSPMQRFAGFARFPGSVP